MKRIGLGITYYLPNLSGLTVYAQRLAEELVKRGYEVVVLSARFEKKLKKEEIINGVKVKRLGGQKIGKGFLMWSYPKESLKMVLRVDVVNCHLPSIESFWLALWGKVFRKKVVITHHCEFNFKGNLGNILISILSFPMHLITYILADKIVGPTKDYAQNSLFLRLFKNKTKYILPPIKVSPGKRKNNKKRNKIVGFVGRITWEKGLGYLIEAMDKVDANLELVGPYDGVSSDDTFRELKNKQKRKIKFWGKISDARLVSFYQKIDCLVLPSINNLEAFGMVQAEAIRYGTPAVASNLPGVRAVVKMTKMGEIAQVANSQDLAKKINLVLKRGKKYYQNRAKNIDLFDYKKSVDKYERAFST